MDWLTILTNAGLPAVTAEVNRFGKVEATFSRELTPAESLLFLQLTDPDEAEYQTSKQQIQAAYQNMIARLQQIQSAANPTNAQVIQAIRDEALYIERIMKVIKRLIL